MQDWLAAGNLKISRTDREILRGLTGEVTTLAARPIEDKKQYNYKKVLLNHKFGVHLCVKTIMMCTTSH